MQKQIRPNIISMQDQENIVYIHCYILHNIKLNPKYALKSNAIAVTFD